MIYSTQNGVTFGPFGTDAAQRMLAKHGAAKVASIGKESPVAPYVVTFNNNDTLTVESGARVAGGDLAGAMLNSVYNIALWVNAVLGENKRRQLAADLAVNEGMKD